MQTTLGNLTIKVKTPEAFVTISQKENDLSKPVKSITLRNGEIWELKSLLDDAIEDIKRILKGE